MSDEQIILDLLKTSELQIKIPKERMWYDFLIEDFHLGTIPVNIKSSTLENADNTGNLAMCVYAYTDEKLNLELNYNNGVMSQLLLNKLTTQKINKNNKKDYYFLVINKKNTKEIIINSVK